MALDKEARLQEQKLLQELNNHKEQMLSEKANRQAAELQSRPDLTQEQVKAVRYIHVHLNTSKGVNPQQIQKSMICALCCLMHLQTFNDTSEQIVLVQT